VVRLVSMMGLYFVVLVSVGILRPVKNALALDGRAEGDFYQVYLVSAIVVLFAPIFNHLADRIRWRTLIPATAGFFALNLVLFRAVYSEGDTTFGLVFYGWYDLFAAALVTQFFMAVQIFFNARDAKAAIPLVIAAGSMGVVFGGVITGAFSQAVGTPNLLLVAAAFVGVFAMALPFLWTGYPPVRSPGRKGRAAGVGDGFVEDFRQVFSNGHIRLIAGLVLVTVLVKQIVDYEFNEVSRVFAGEDLDAISSFQGYVFAVKDFLPILVLLPLGPLLRRFGVGFAVLLLPVFMLGSTIALGVAFGVLTATIAKTGDSMFRYSSERTAREILYVPVPTELKLKAKAYIDAGVEKGFGKAAAGVLIGVSVAVVGYRSVTWVAVALAVGWCVMAWAAKKWYVEALAESIRGRFANLDVGFASLTERSTLAMVEAALRSDDRVEVEFALGLVEQAGSVDAKHLADELELLLGHPDEDVRVRVLRLIARFPGLVPEEPIRAKLTDPRYYVAEAAVGALAAACDDEADVAGALAELVESAEERVRLAVLSWLLAERADSETARALGAKRAAALLPGDPGGNGARVGGADVETRRELALVGGLLGGPNGTEIVAELLDDTDEIARGFAIRSAGRSSSPELQRRLLTLLVDPSVRGRAKESLIRAGEAAVELGERRLSDPGTDPAIRRRLTRVLAHIPEQRTVRALEGVVADERVPWDVRYHSLKALNKLRTVHGDELDFDRDVAVATVDAMLGEAADYLALAAAIDHRPRADEGAVDPPQPGRVLLRTAAWEAWHDRREVVFRLLGLVIPPDEVYRSHGTLGGTDDRKKANALEWLERTLGHALFKRVLPVLDGRPAAPKTTSGQRDLARLVVDHGDPWVAELARLHGASAERATTHGGHGLDVIAKAFLLQKVDLLEGARSSHLGLLAGIAEEVEADPGEVLVRQGEPHDALYVIIKGSAELSGVGGHTLTAGEGTPFGTWSLIDSAPSVVGARALEHTRLLRITRSDFQELVSDHPELATGMLQALARRLRSLVA
jgi:ATP/ADP translocase